MKKIATWSTLVATAAAMTVALAGCGSKPDPDAGKPVDPKTQTSSNPDYQKMMEASKAAAANKPQPAATHR